MAPVTRSQTNSLPAQKISPNGKTYRLAPNLQGRLVFFISPETKKKENVIYRIKKEDKENQDFRRYVGSAKQFGPRVLNYESQINSTVKQRRQHIVHAMRRSPKKFTLKVLEQHPGSSERELLAQEERVQNTYQTRLREHGYNHSRPTLERSRTKSGRN